MIAKIIVNFILITALGVIQAAFISGLGAPAANLNLLLVILLFILGFAGFNYAIYWVIGTGLVLEIFSFLPFGVYLISLSLMIVGANFLLNYFFTNRSLYSFLSLTALATLIYWLIVNLAALILAPALFYFPWTEGNFWLSGFEQIGLNLLFTFIIFYLLYFLGKNFRPVFLFKTKKY